MHNSSIEGKIWADEIAETEALKEKTSIGFKNRSILERETLDFFLQGVSKKIKEIEQCVVGNAEELSKRNIRYVSVNEINNINNLDDTNYLTNNCLDNFITKRFHKYFKSCPQRINDCLNNAQGEFDKEFLTKTDAESATDIWYGTDLPLQILNKYTTTIDCSPYNFKTLGLSSANYLADIEKAKEGGKIVRNITFTIPKTKDFFWIIIKKNKVKVILKDGSFSTIYFIIKPIIKFNFGFVYLDKAFNEKTSYTSHNTFEIMCQNEVVYFLSGLDGIPTLEEQDEAFVNSFAIGNLTL